MVRLRLLSVASLAAISFAFGCGGSDEKYYIPADSQIRPFQAPDEEEPAEDDDMSGEETAPAAEPSDFAPPAIPAPAPPAKPKGKAGSGSP